MQSPSEKIAFSIVQTLQDAGFVAYFAGGCVRDRLMNRDPMDFDVATSARPEQVLKLFPHSQKVGVAFGVVLVRTRRPANIPKTPDNPDFLQIEVATFRADAAYSDGRHPDSVRFTDAHEDAQRRDFTCNGLFLDPVKNQLHDFVGGQVDIQSLTLRAIGHPEARFAEDHLRLLRTIRFAAKLNFTIEPVTFSAIQTLAPHIRTISRERVGAEFGMILEHPSRPAAIRLLEQSSLMRHIWPTDLPIPQSPLDQGTPRRIDYLPNDPPRPLSLAALLLDYGNTSQQNAPTLLREAFALSNQERDDLAWLLDKLPRLLDASQWTRPILKKLLADPRWLHLYALYLSAQHPDPNLAPLLETYKQEGVAPTPFIDGAALISLGAIPGPTFRQWLVQLYDQQLEGQLKTEKEARAAAEKLIHPEPPIP